MENKTELKWHQKTITVILLLIFFFPIGLYLMWKNEIWSKTARWIVTAIFAVAIITNAGGNKSSKTSSSKSSETDNASLESSKKAYRAGYQDGMLNYGSPSAPSYEYFLGNHKDITGADIYVYKSGYEDAVLGKSAEY